MELSRPYAFGPYRLDCARRVLTRSGIPVPLSSRAFDILRVLVETSQQVVTRTEIMSRVWPGLVVEEHNLSVQMSKLRRALGDADGSIIATIPGRGYQFVAPLEPAPSNRIPAAPFDTGPAPAPPIAPPTARPRRLVAAALLLLAVAGLGTATGLRLIRPSSPRLSIVVMPFRDLSDHPGSGYLADAITDDLTTELAHLPGSLVIARETADFYAGRAVPAVTIGRTLHVRYLLEGSLRAEDEVLHVNAQLIETTHGTHLWAERFDVSRAQPAEARDQIVARLAGALDIRLVQVEAARSAHDRTSDPDAVDLFFQARSILDHDDSLRGFDGAQALLERAVAMRPGFADAQAALGEMLLRKARSADDPATTADLAEARDAIARALDLSPDNVVALTARAHAQYVAGRYVDAAYSARAALALDPNDVEAQDVLASCAVTQGRVDEAADALQAILRLDPDGASHRQRELRLGNLRLLQGRYAEAEDWVRRSVAGDPDIRPGADDLGRAEGARLLLIAAVGLGGRPAAARALYADYARLWPNRSAWRIAALTPRYMSGLPGYRAMARALIEAGMPSHADEHADLHVPADAHPLAETSFGATPQALPGASTVDTPALAILLRKRRPRAVIDLGSGVAVPPGAIWQDQDSPLDGLQFAAAVLRDHPARDPLAPVVVMGDGTFGSTAYNVALQLVRAGVSRVVWYRGGEEAWDAARFPSADLRN